MMTLSRMSSTDEFVTCDCVAIVHTAYAAPSVNVARLTGTKIRSGLKIVITFKRISTNFAPSDPSRIFDTPWRGAASIRFEAHAVTSLQKRERRRGRRRETVRNQMQEFDQTVAPRRAESRREIGNRPFVQVTGEPVQQRIAEPSRRRRLRGRRSRTDHQLIFVQLAHQPDRVGGVGVGRRHRRSGRTCRRPAVFQSSPPRRCPYCMDDGSHERPRPSPAHLSRPRIRRQSREFHASASLASRSATTAATAAPRCTPE